MSGRKPLNKYNKAELYQLAKDNRDIVKSLKQNLTMAMNEVTELKSQVSDLTDKLREERNKNRENQKVLKRIQKQKEFEADERKLNKGAKPRRKKNLVNFFRNLLD